MLSCGEHLAWGAVELQVFEPLKVVDDHAPRLAISGAEQRTLPAVLLLYAGGVAPADRWLPLQRRTGAAFGVISRNGRLTGHLRGPEG
jgi:hypothetical protein